MLRLFTFTFCAIYFLFFSPPIAQSETLYLFAELRSTPSQEHSLDLIQCLFEKSERMIEVVERNSTRRPLLEILERKNKIVANYVFHNSVTLGEFPNYAFAQPVCDRISTILKNNIIQTTETSFFPNTPPSPEKNFLQKYWPYFGILTAATAGYLLYERSKQKSSPPTYESRGFVLE